MGLLDDLASLFIDPSASGGGMIPRVFGFSPPASTSTPKVAPGATASNGSGLLGVDSTFGPQTGGLLGNSSIMNALRDGFVGMSGANGYTGLSAVGAGATAATKYNQNRRMFDVQNKLYGQQYRKGQQDILGGAIGNNFSLMKVNAIRQDNGLQPLSMEDLTNNPGYISDPLSGQAVASQASGQTPGIGAGSMAPTASPTSSMPSSDMASINGNVNDAYGGTPAAYPMPAVGPGAQAPGQPLAQTMGQPAAQPNGQSSGAPDNPLATATDPSDPVVSARLRRDAFIYGPEYANLELNLIKSGLPYVAASKEVEAQHTNVSDRPGSITRRDGKVVGEAPTLQRVQDPNGPPGQMILAHVYPSSGRVVPIGTGNGGAPGGSSGDLTNQNNPGNLRPVGAGPGGGFQQYPTLEAGVAGVIQNLRAYGKKGINTIGGPNGIIATWAPPSDNNDTQGYIDYVSKMTGIAPDQKLDLSNPKTLTALSLAIANREQGGLGGQQGGGSQGSGGVVAEIGPAQQASLKARGEHLEGTFGAEVDSEADNAKQQNFLLDQMRQESQPWSMGPTAPYFGEMRRWTQQMFPNNQALAEQVGNWQAFNKNAMELTRVAVRGTSSKAAVQEFTMIQSALPGDTMSRPAFDHIADQLSSVNDYKLAKQTAASQWRQEHGTLEGFDTDFNRNASPGAFLLLRMKPEDVQTMAANLQKTDSGRATLQRLAAETQYAMSLGFGGNQ